MISCISTIHFLGVFLISSAFICEIVGSSNQPEELLNASKNHTFSGEDFASQSVKSAELCKLLRTVKTSFFSESDPIHSSFVLPKLYTHCDVSDTCLSLSCRALLGNTKVKAGVDLKLCEPIKTVELWTDVPKVWKKKLTHAFSASEVPHRIELFDKEFGHMWNLSSPENYKYFIKVFFNLEEDVYENKNYLSLISSVQICETELESSCQNITLLNLPKHQVRFACEVTSSQEAQYLNTREYLSISSLPLKSSSSRSSRSVWNEDIHKKVEPQASHKIGQPCDTQNIFSCQEGASCVQIKNTEGICKCLSNYEEDSNGGCVESRNQNPSGPPSQPVSGSSSTSAALGALLSVSILMALAAAVFFGTKYHVFSRLRSRLPLQLRCWPWPYFRRSSPLEDNVSMVNPIDQDDDDPLLL